MARAASSHSGERQPDRALPNGVWWLDKASHSHDILYGENFVVQRPKLGGEGLIPYQEGLTRIQLMPTVPSASTRSRAPLLPPGRDSVYDIMDYTLEESPEHRSAQLQLPAPAEPQVAGLVLWRPGDAQVSITEPNDLSYCLLHSCLGRLQTQSCRTVSCINATSLMAQVRIVMSS